MRSFIIVVALILFALPARAERTSPPGCRLEDWHRAQLMTSEGSPALGVGAEVAWLPNFDGRGLGQAVAGGPSTWLVSPASIEGTVVAWQWNGLAFDAAPAWQVFGQLSEILGQTVSSAGDINGDGYSDLVAGAGHAFASVPVATAYAWYGGPGAPRASADWALPAALRGEEARVLARGIGDVNGDGFDDVAFLKPIWEWFPNESRIYIYHGSAAGLAVMPDATIPCTPHNARDIAAAGDINGDGFDDLLVSVPYRGPGDVGEVDVLLGSPAGLTPVPAQVLAGIDVQGSFGSSMVALGDLDRDGFGDVFIGEPGDLSRAFRGRALVLRGSPAGLVPWWQHEGTGNEHHYGKEAAAPGDIDGDGWDDVALSLSFDPTGPAGRTDGIVRIFFGSASGLAPEAELEHYGPFGARDAGRSLAAPGDVDGDGLADLLAGARNTVNGGGVELLLGRRRNHVPEIPPATDVTIDCGALALRSGASDPDGDSLSFTWSSDCPDVVFSPSVDAAEPVAVFDASCGRTCSVQVVVDDARCGLAAASFNVRVEDRTPPVIAGGGLDLHDVWPPNGKVVTFSLADFMAHAQVIDACDPSPSWTFSDCIAEEDGMRLPAGECGVSATGDGLWVRARRAGTARDGRRYGVAIRAQDACGNESDPAVIGFIRVPHDQR